MKASQNLEIEQRAPGNLLAQTLSVSLENEVMGPLCTATRETHSLLLLMS